MGVSVSPRIAEGVQSKRLEQHLAEQALGALRVGSSRPGLCSPLAGVSSSPYTATHQLPDLEILSSVPISLFTFKEEELSKLKHKQINQK